MSRSNASRNAVTDAARARDLDGLAVWKVRSCGGTRPSQSSPACSATGTSLARKADDLHVAGVVAARHQAVLGLDEVERDHICGSARISAAANGGLDEHVVDGSVA